MISALGYLFIGIGSYLLGVFLGLVALSNLQLLRAYVLKNSKTAAKIRKHFIVSLVAQAFGSLVLGFVILLQ